MGRVPTSGGVYRCRRIASWATARSGRAIAEADRTLNDLPPHRYPTPRPSACPGLLRIVPARDGGICRVRLPGGRVEGAQLRRLAEAAGRHGSGVLELTNRANLQIRGVPADQADGLIQCLLDAGLGPRAPGADDVRNLLLSPAAGLDPQARLDVRPLAWRLLRLLEEEPRFHALSPKFALSLDGGEALAMLDHPHDLWLSALDGPDGEPAFAFGLAGCVPRGVGDGPALAAFPAAGVEAGVSALLHLFLDVADPECTRMRHLLAREPAEALLRRLRERLDVPMLQGPWLDAWRRPPASAEAPVGVHPQRQAGLCLVGGAPALGRLGASVLARLADLAERVGDGHLRLTPWQGLLLPNVPLERAAEALAGLEALGLETRPGSPLARLVACSGSVGCARSLADTKADALGLARRWPADLPFPAIHLSGCPRSCAAAHVAPYTLLAVAAGRYDLFRRDAGHGGFGRPLARGLDLDAATERLAEDARSARHD